MVDLTVECIPEGLIKSGQIRTLLDYGCAEGAITDQVTTGLPPFALSPPLTCNCLWHSNDLGDYCTTPLALSSSLPSHPLYLVSDSMVMIELTTGLPPSPCNCLSLSLFCIHILTLPLLICIHILTLCWHNYLPWLVVALAFLPSLALISAPYPCPGPCPYICPLPWPWPFHWLIIGIQLCRKLQVSSDHPFSYTFLLPWPFPLPLHLILTLALSLSLVHRLSVMSQTPSVLWPSLRSWCPSPSTRRLHLRATPCRTRWQQNDPSTLSWLCHIYTPFIYAPLTRRLHLRATPCRTRWQKMINCSYICAPFICAIFGNLHHRLTMVPYSLVSP